MVERFFRDISENRIRRDSFTSVPELELAIDLYMAHHNANPKPFIWTATPPTSWPRSREPRPPWRRVQDQYISEWRTTLAGRSRCRRRRFSAPLTASA